MGWCHEFGTEIEAGCDHPMVAGPTSCFCADCGTSCKGRFEGGCEAVWLRGARPNAPRRPANYEARAMFEAASGDAPTNGTSGRSATAAEGNETLPLAPGPEPAPDGDLHRRLVGMEAAITRLVAQVERQSERQALMEQQLGDLGKVLGELGAENDDRQGLLELRRAIRLRQHSPHRKRAQLLEEMIAPLPPRKLSDNGGHPVRDLRSPL